MFLVRWFQFKGSRTKETSQTAASGAVPALEAFDTLVHHLPQTPVSAAHMEHTSKPECFHVLWHIVGVWTHIINIWYDM